MGHIVNQVFSGITAAPGQPPGSNHSVFDGLRSFGLEPGDFISHFHQPFANVSGFPQQTAFVILFHSRSLLVFVASLPRSFFTSPLVKSHELYRFEIGEPGSETTVSPRADDVNGDGATL